MTIAAYNHHGVVYYLQRTSHRDRYEIRCNPGRRRGKLVRVVKSKSEWAAFVNELRETCTS